jgi:heptosyltransferase-3
MVQGIRAKDPGRKVICISKTQHLGDIVACEPVARQVRKNDPDAFIIWCLQKSYVELMQHHPAVDYFLGVECLTEWLLFSDSGLFDQVIELEMNGKPCKTCGLALSRQNNFGVTFENYYRLGTLLEVYLRCANYQVEDKSPQIFIPRSAFDEVGNLLKPYEGQFVTVHCSSNETCRDWCVEKWGELLRWLAKEWPVQIIEIGLKPVLSHLKVPRYLSLCGKLSILETAEVVRRSALFIGVDSGPAHLANAVGTKGVILIGEYAGFSHYRPYNGNFGDASWGSLVFSSGVASEIEVEAVQKAVESKLSEPGQKEARNSQRPSDARPSHA